MNTKEQFRRYDTKRAPGVYVTLHKETMHDEHADAPDQNDDGFWPSLDIGAAGFIGPGRHPRQRFAEAQAKAEARMKAWRDGDWHYMGLRIRAEIDIVRDGSGVTHELTSAGLWGVESDSGEAYLAEIFANEALELAADIAALGGSLIHWSVAR